MSISLSQTKRRVKRDSVKDKQHKLIEHTRLVTPSAQRQLINNELENCLARRRQQTRNDDDDTNDDNLDDINNAKGRDNMFDNT